MSLINPDESPACADGTIFDSFLPWELRELVQMTKIDDPTAAYLKIFHGWYTVENIGKAHGESAGKATRKEKGNGSSKVQKKGRKEEH